MNENDIAIWSWNKLVRASQSRGSGGYSDEAKALFTRMTSEPDSSRKTLINQLIVNGKAHGWWAVADMLKIQAAHDSQAATLNWIEDAHNSILIGAPTFTTDKGFKGDGTVNNYINLNFTPSSDGNNFKQNSASFGVSINDNNVTGTNNLGVGANVGANTYMIFSTQAVTAYGQTRGCLNSGGTWTDREHSRSTKGFHFMNRSASNVIKVGKNFGQTASTVASTAVSTNSLALGGIKTSTGLIYGNTFEYSFAWCGGALTASQYYWLIRDVNTYLSGVGCELIDVDTYADITANPVCDILTGQSNCVANFGTLASLADEYKGIKSNIFINECSAGTVLKMNATVNTRSLTLSERFGPEQTFCKGTVAFTGSPATIIKVNENGVLISNWASPSGYIWKCLTQTIDDYLNYCTIKGITPTFRSLLWMQGESDISGGTLAAYEAALTAFINNIRAYNAALADIKIVIVKISLGFTGLSDTDTNTINGIYDNIAGALSDIELIDTNALTLTFSDALHYTPASILTIGEEWSDLINV